MIQTSMASDPTAERKYSVIVPHKNSFLLLTRLLDSIPDSPDFQIIIIDDNSNITEKSYLQNHRFNENVTVIYNSESGGAGKARNIALKHAKGKWLLFADSDDFFCENMHSLIEAYYNTDADIVYFGTNSVYNNDLTSAAFRHQRYLKLVTDYVEEANQDHEDAMRYYFNPPWGKLIRRKLVEENRLKFEEILASNDIYFSITTGFHAKKVAATTDVLYTITVTEGSVSNSFSQEHFDARFRAVLKANDFLRSIGKSKYQKSVLYYIGRAHAFGLKYVVYVLQSIIKHRSNLLIGMEKIVGYKTMLSRRENPSFADKKVG
jgi:glycosyltransferase involved in cell wall biosynthesis